HLTRIPHRGRRQGIRDEHPVQLPQLRDCLAGQTVALCQRAHRGLDVK
ncbi:MAG: hypothetical protein JO363_01315, partial [Solirubrobacterales bacterium]|nr:hypothetical protein [Solirubrobacterales bacterium]